MSADEAAATSGNRTVQGGEAAAARAELRARGFAFLGPVLGPDDVARLRAAADRLVPAAHPGPYGRIVHDPWRRDPGFAELVAARAAPAACAIAGPLVLFQDTLIVKPPGSAAAINWHQDYAYWPLDAPAGVTMWIALDDADPGNGCLRYLPGTHREGERRPADFAAGASMPARPDLPPLDGEARAAAGGALDAVVPAGWALLHDPLVWHMSPANPSARPRRAWSISWVRPGVRWDPGHAPHPFTVGARLGRGDPLEPARHPAFGDWPDAATASAAPPRSPR